MKKKDIVLGMSYGKARHILHRNIMFYLVQSLGLDICYRCKEKISNVEHFSVEHKQAWLNSSTPLDTFLDLDNISFSHQSCNYSAAKRTNKKYNSKEERVDATKALNAASHRKHYSTDRRHKKYEKHGY